MNLRRGLIRLWVLGSAIWMAGGGPAAQAQTPTPVDWDSLGARVDQQPPRPKPKPSTLSFDDLVPHQAGRPTALPKCPEDVTVVWNNCQGTFTSPRGAKYVGEFHDDRLNGLGTATYPSGEKYVGEFRDGQFNGKGTYTFPSGQKYVGDFRDGMPNGQGKEHLASGTEYVGDFRNGKHSGQGTAIWPNGRKYVGEWRDDKRNGQGTFTWPNGEKYVGEWHDNERSGQGTSTQPSGARHVGEWRDDKPNGRGKEYLSDGSVGRSGIWANGAFIRPAAVASNAPSRAPTPSSSGRAYVSLVGEEGTFKVPVTINGVIRLGFTVDSGAADVTIPADVVATLMRTGTLRPEDFLGTQIYRMADGSTAPSKTFRIRSLKVGDKVIENVTGSMAKVEGGLLLGQSFLSRFHRWSMNNSKQVLELE